MAGELKEHHGKRVLIGCPCFKESEGEDICMNNDQISTVCFVSIEPSLLTKDLIEKIQYDNICFQLLEIDTTTKKVRCVSSNTLLKIKNQIIEASDLKEAMDLLTGGLDSNRSELCSSCLYGLLDSFTARKI